MTDLTRRYFLASAGLAAVSLGAGGSRVLADEAPKRRILAGGGMMLVPADKERALLKYMLSLTGKQDPTVCFLPTAQADQPQAIVAWYEIMNELPCRPRHLRLINNSTNLKELDTQLLSMDVIFVGGGNTLSMLALWKAHGIDAILKKAWEKGVLLAGESAGMICWFEQGVSDSRPGELTAVDGLGWIKGSACPHYHHKDRQPSCGRLLLSGALKECIACDDGGALLYEGEKLVKAVGATPRVGAWRVRREGDKVTEEALKVDLVK